MKDGHPKIADFGLSRTLTNVDMSITVAGTPY